ncbi:MAG: hypothetical protein ABIH34_00210 [Nanoarchaeota archaeon]
MIDRLKGILAVEDKVGRLQLKLEEMNKHLETISSKITKACENVSLTEEKAGGIMDALKEQKGMIHEELSQISEARKKLVSEMRELKLVKGRIHEEMQQELKEELERSLKKFHEQIAQTLIPLQDLVKEASSHRTEIKDMTTEMKRFEAIAKSLKEKDFTLDRHARNLAAVEEEKLKLMRRIDSLERMIGKQRRHGKPMHLNTRDYPGKHSHGKKIQENRPPRNHFPAPDARNSSPPSQGSPGKA